MDERFGLGGWRPLERFMLFQTDKYRPIDSGKKPGHNSASLERETIFTCSVQETLAHLQPMETFFPGIGRFVLGTEDMKHAYRQAPCIPLTCAPRAQPFGIMKPRIIALSSCEACPLVCPLPSCALIGRQLSFPPCAEEPWHLQSSSSLTLRGL